MRFDRFFRRQVPNSSSPVPPTPATTRRGSDRTTEQQLSFNDSPIRDQNRRTQPIMNRPDYIRALQQRMRMMEQVPTSSFYDSYAGEFDILLGEDRKAARRPHEFETSERVENANRNRYANILSNEPTRVKLQAISPGENDYINANKVTGHTCHPGYIATQAPLLETTPHFWQMVYESTTPAIIMLTREQDERSDIIKSEKYWPSVGQNLLFNDYMVHAISEEYYERKGIIKRRFQVARVVDKRKKHARDLVDADSLIPPATDSPVWETPARGRAQPSCDDDDVDGTDNEELLKHLELIGPVLEVVQLQYLDWPDQDVPHSPHTLLDLCRHVDSISGAHTVRTGIAAPPIVHCSAGVGRTGTFIAVDKTLRRLYDAFSEENGISKQPVYVEEIRELVRQLKNERSKMVQTPEQYRFIHEAVLEGMLRWERGEALFRESDQNQESYLDRNHCADETTTIQSE